VADLVEGLAMIPGLYTYAATALVAGALAFGAGWQTQEWRHGKQIADIQAQHATALASANQKALDDTIKMQRTKDAAIQQAETRAAQNAAAAAAARRTVDGLRDTLYAFRASLPSLAPAAVIERADTAAELFGACAARYTDVAAAADRHASDAMMLLQSWPKTD
jgi:hypothetical protein